MSLEKLTESLKKFNAMAKAAPETITESSEAVQMLKKHESEVFTTFANAIAVALGQVESITGSQFETAKDAQEFVEEVMKSMRTKGKSSLMTVLRRFDRVGSQQFSAQFKRKL